MNDYKNISHIHIEHYEYTKHKKYIKEIYENSFPPIERFKFSILKSCNKRRNIHLSCILSDNIPVGMQFTIDLPNDITYLMYYAIDKKHRNKKIGSKALQHLIITRQNVLLCIEKPIDKLTNLRKDFYIQNGFCETNTFIEDAGVQYEILSSLRGYKPTAEDLKNRYKYMPYKKYIWNKIRKTFDTDSIKIIFMEK